MKVDQIYVSLIDEGVTVWRPVPALQVSPDTYVILKPDEYDPDDETWEFIPGSVVVVENRRTADGDIRAAVRPAPASRLTA